MNYSPNERVPWSELIRQELLPFHGRLAGSLRTTFAVAIAVTATMVFRTPAAAPGIYLIFLISYETPYLTFTAGLISLCFQCAGVASALLLVIATDNAPMARVLGTALFSFISAFLLRTMRRRGGIDFGVFSLTSLALWDMRLPEDQLVRLSMWPVATGALGVICAVTIEYIFAHRDPFLALHKEFEARLLAVENYLRAYSGDQRAPHSHLAASEIVRLSFAGQGHMLALLEEISTRREGVQKYGIELPVLLPHLFRLLDLTANLTLDGNAAEASVERRAHATRLADACAEFRQNPLEPGPALRSLQSDSGDDLLSQIEDTLVDLEMMEPHPAISLRTQSHTTPPAPSWFVADAWTNSSYLTFSLEIAFCSTLCYIVYSALAWPGISTAVVTVLIVGLNTTGAISQKLIFRILGSFLGGVVCGIGSVVFLFPHMDTITSLIALVCAVAFVASWIARSPHFSYIGMQIAFSFFLVALGAFSAPVDMTPARDRLVGIGLALLVVWAVFLEITPVRTVSEMRATLAQVLALEGELLILPESSTPAAGRDAARVREVIIRGLVNVRGMSELAPYEFSSRSDIDRVESERLVDASLAAGSLFLAIESWIRQHDGAAQVARVTLANTLSRWSHALHSEANATPVSSLTSPAPNRAAVLEAAALPAQVAAAQVRLAAHVSALLHN